MKFTVLGATGFIGRYLVRQLTGAGHEVVAPGREDPNIYENELGHVIYCIGLTADFRSRPFETVRAHVSILADVLEKARFESLVYLSSTRVYARSQSGTEAVPLLVSVSDPSDLYNLTKLTGESLCLSCGITGVKVARLSNVIGFDSASENFLISLIREALSGRIVLRSSPLSSKDYILLDDIAWLLPRIALDGRARIYNLASGFNLRHADIIERLRQLTGCEVEVVADAPVIEFPEIDVKNIQTEFGFVPASVIDTIDGLLTECRENFRFN